MRETPSSAPAGYFGALKDGVLAQALERWQDWDCDGIPGRGRYRRAGLGKAGGSWGVEIPSAEGSPDLTWSQTGWPQLGASSKHGLWVVLPPLLLALQWG